MIFAPKMVISRNGNDCVPFFGYEYKRRHSLPKKIWEFGSWMNWAKTAVLELKQLRLGPDISHLRNVPTVATPQTPQIILKSTKSHNDVSTIDATKLQTDTEKAMYCFGDLGNPTGFPAIRGHIHDHAGKSPCLTVPQIRSESAQAPPGFPAAIADLICASMAIRSSSDLRYRDFAARSEPFQNRQNVQSSPPKRKDGNVKSESKGMINSWPLYHVVVICFSSWGWQKDLKITTHLPWRQHSHGSVGLLTDFLVLFGHLLLYLPMTPMISRALQFFDHQSMMLGQIQKWGKSRDFCALETYLDYVENVWDSSHIFDCCWRVAADLPLETFTQRSASAKKGRGNKRLLTTSWPIKPLTFFDRRPPQEKDRNEGLLNCLLHSYNFPLLLVHHLTRWHGCSVIRGHQLQLMLEMRQCQGFSKLTNCQPWNFN